MLEWKAKVFQVLDGVCDFLWGFALNNGSVCLYDCLLSRDLERLWGEVKAKKLETHAQTIQ